MPSISSPAASLEHDSGLAPDSLSPFEVLAQSVSGIAPSAAAAAGPALVALNAGGAVVYSFLASTVVLMLVAWCIRQFVARRGTGTLMDYVTESFGPGTGFVAAVGLAFGYVLIASTVLAGLVVYSAPLLDLVGIPTGGKAVAVIVMTVTVALAVVAMVRGVELSTRTGVVLEAVSIVILLIVLAIVAAKHGLSSAPLHLPGTTFSSTASGMVLAILSYVGFESAACMGAEARDGKRSIPRAVMLSAIIAGLIYLVSSYVQLLGFGTAEAMTASAAPLNDLADGAGIHAMGYVMDVGIVASFFACVTGSINAASRLLHAMGEQRMVHPAASAAHPQFRTPHLAIYLLSACALVVPVVMVLAGTETMNTYAYCGTIGTFGYMVAYILIAVATPVMVWRQGGNVVLPLLIGGVAAVSMGYVLWHNVYPVPPAPYAALPRIFLGLMALTALWYGVRGRLSHREFRAGAFGRPAAEPA